MAAIRTIDIAAWNEFWFANFDVWIAYIIYLTCILNLTGIHACVTLVVVHGVASLFDARDGFYLGSQTSLDSKVVHSVL